MSYFKHIFQKYEHVKHVCCGEKMEMWYNELEDVEITWFCMNCDNEIDSEVIAE